MKKRFILAAMAFVMAIGMTACGSTNEQKEGAVFPKDQ